MESFDPNQVLANAIAMVLLAVATAVGGLLNRWLAARRKRIKDLAAADEKIRRIYHHLGLEPWTEAVCMNDLFKEIRRINAHLGIKEDGDASHSVAIDRAAGAGQAGLGREDKGEGDRGTS